MAIHTYTVRPPHVPAWVLLLILAFSAAVFSAAGGCQLLAFSCGDYGASGVVCQCDAGPLCDHPGFGPCSECR